MKVVNRAVITALGLLFAGSGAFAQSLADAKKALDAEQFQKAKVMLKNLTVTQASKDENFFYLGMVYIDQDYIDSARISFNKGIAVNPKSALNYVGLGLADRQDKNPSSAKANFDKALAMAGKDAKPYIYVAEAYVYKKPGEIKPLITPDPEAALAVLDKAKVFGAKDPDYFGATGDVYRAKNDASQAYQAYQAAQALDPNNPKFFVALGVLVKNANNFDDAVADFQSALSKDPNYGPAYREWAETNFLQANYDKKNAIAKDKEAVDHYKKYLDLTDRSVESRLRYADFLISAHDYKTLEAETNDIAKTAGSNLRVYRYLGYSAYENGNYAAGLTAINKWIKEADPKRIIPQDYLYLGRLQMKTGQDSLGILTLQNVLAQDTTQVELYQEIAKAYYAKAKYMDAAKAYDAYIRKGKGLLLSDFISMGLSYYYAFGNQEDAEPKTHVKADTMLLAKADSAYAYVNKKLTAGGKPANPGIILYRAQVADAKETDRTNNYKGYAAPFYEQYIALVAPTNPPDEATKKRLVNAYTYLGYYYEFVIKDDAKAADVYGKAKDIDPTNKSVVNYFTRKSAGGKGK
jgi:tetratricopeptide (TPR) repeat protein/disulfide oxidoreductase YuzD